MLVFGFRSLKKLTVDLCCHKDGHWFPETYLLAVMQIREGLLKVLSVYVEQRSLTITEAVKIVQDVLFNTANQLYSLNIPLVPAPPTVVSSRSPSKSSWTNNLAKFQHFLDQNPSVRFLRLQWLDYTNTLRLRILPIKQAVRMFSDGRFIGIVEAVFGLLQTDKICPGFSATNEYTMYPQFAGISTLGFLHASDSLRKQSADSDGFNRSALREPQRICNRPVRVSEKEWGRTASLPQDITP